jgi:hypothetical protein
VGKAGAPAQVRALVRGTRHVAQRGVKKIIKRKLHLDRTTIQTLSRSATARVRGGAPNAQPSPLPATTTTVLTCMISCPKSDCCLEYP